MVLEKHLFPQTYSMTLQKSGKKSNLVDLRCRGTYDREFIAGEFLHSFDVTQKGARNRRIEMYILW